jgi:hypothetical protein
MQSGGPGCSLHVLTMLALEHPGESVVHLA